LISGVETSKEGNDEGLDFGSRNFLVDYLVTLFNPLKQMSQTVDLSSS